MFSEERQHYHPRAKSMSTSKPSKAPSLLAGRSDLAASRKLNALFDAKRGGSTRIHADRCLVR